MELEKIQKVTCMMREFKYNLLENGTDEPVCRAETESQMQRTNVWTPRGESGGSGGGGGMNWEIGTDMYTLICIKQITNKNLLYKKIDKIKFKNSKK